MAIICATRFVSTLVWRVTLLTRVTLYSSFLFYSRRGQGTSSHGQARYVLSTQQEEEIRDAFLKDRLDGFTMVCVT